MPNLDRTNPFSERTPAVALAAALILSAVGVAALSLDLLYLDSSVSGVTETHTVLLAAERLLGTLADAETGQRGYLLTSQDRYLTAYTAARARLGDEIGRLQSLVQHDPSRAARLPEITRLAAEKMQELAETITLARAGRSEAALAVVRTDRGQTIMEGLRTELAGFSADEQALRTARLASFERSERFSLWVAGIAGIAAALSAAAGGLLLLQRGRRSASALSIARNELDAIYASAPVALGYVDRSLRFAAANQRLSDIDGLSPHGHLGRTVREVVGDTADTLEPIYRRILETGEAALDLDIQTTTGSRSDEVRDYIASYAPVRDSSGEVIGINISVLDVTARKAAENEVRRLNASLERQVAQRTADLEAANQQLESFAYTVSHDLRAPLRGMEGFARILVDDFAGQLGADGQLYARRIMAAAQRMEALIADLLTYSRLQRSEVTLRVMDPYPTIQSASDEAVAAAEGPTHVAIQTPIPAVLAEPVVFAHVMRNLLTNAAKFRKPDLPAEIEVRAEAVGERVRVWVEDYGIGIAPEHQNKIFNAFERLHGQEAYPGTGIGLAIVQAGVKRLGGTVGVVSSVDEGARFWIELAAAQPNSSPTQDHAAHA